MLIAGMPIASERERSERYEVQMAGKDKLLQPTRADREKVKTMAALGIPHDIVARRFGFSEEDLDRVFEQELRTALPEMRAMGGANLFASAKAGNPSAVFFWLKTRAGWSETANSEKPPPDEDAVKSIEKPGVRTPHALQCARLLRTYGALDPAFGKNAQKNVE